MTKPKAFKRSPRPVMGLLVRTIRGRDETVRQEIDTRLQRIYADVAALERYAVEDTGDILSLDHLHLQAAQRYLLRVMETYSPPSVVAKLRCEFSRIMHSIDPVTAGTIAPPATVALFQLKKN